MKWNLGEELKKLDRPHTLMMGVISGYLLTGCFAVLTWIAVASHALPWHWMFAVLLGAKTATNTAAYLALKFDRGRLFWGGVNTAMDAVVMTGAIWATGDSASPLIAIYVLEVTVLALLTNMATTILVGALALGMFIAMAFLTAHHVIMQFPTPLEWSGRSDTYVTMAISFAAFVIVAPTIYTAGMLRKLKENEQRLEAQTAALIEAGKQKAQFMANITHELRTPLQGIIGLGELVQKGVYGETTERQRQAIANQKTSARRLLALIDDLLLLAADETGKVELELSQVKIGELLESAVATTQWMLGGKQLAIELECEPDLPEIRSDRAKVSIIVVNLLSNAIKFTPDGGKIMVHARGRGAGVELAVEDNGIGIPPSELPRVFDEFHQVDGSPSREFGGVGLGLALVRRLVVRLGGTIVVASELGRGSTFTVRLPTLLHAGAPSGV